MTAFEVVQRVFGEALSAANAQRLLSLTLNYLTHLQATGEVQRIAGEPELWTA
jgi:hypothetical protein